MSSVYFVTGATGVVGSAIAERLLARPGARLMLLIRARTDEELRARLDTLLDWWKVPGADRASLAARVEPLRGDTGEPRLGLSVADFERVAASATHLVHSAGVVRMNLPIEQARRAAVGAARHLVELAHAGRRAGVLRKVEYLSTVGVGGRMPGAVPERWLHEPRAFHNTYEQSKAEAEGVIEAAVAEGLPITVHRPSMVVGDATSGRVISFQVFYHLAEFLSGRRTFGVTPAPGPARLDLVPVDHVARAVILSGDRPEAAGRVLHLCSGPGRALPIGPLRERVRRAFETAGVALPRSTVLPEWLFRAAIPVVRRFSGERERRALDTLPIFLDYLAEAQAFDDAQSSAWLAAAGVPAPDPDRFLGPVLDYYLANRRRR